MIKSESSYLIEMRKLLTDKNNWCKGRFYAKRLESGRLSRADKLPYKDANSFCMMGAIDKVYNENKGRVVNLEEIKHNVYNNLMERVGSIIRFNDSPFRKHEDILKLLDNMICDYMEEERNDKV